MLSGLGNRPLITVNSTNTVSEAIALMQQYDIEQLPVVRDEQIVGSLSESGIFNKVMNHPNIKKDVVNRIMEKPFPQVSLDTPVERLAHYINRDNGAILVKEEGGKFLILTKYDIIQSLAND